MSAVWLTLLAVSGYIPPSPAADWHDLRARITPNGIAVLKNALLDPVPTHEALPDVGHDISNCTPSIPIRLVQRNTAVDLVFESLEVTVPALNVLRFDLVFSGVVQGEAVLENALFCVDSLVCTDSVVMSHVRGVTDVTWTLDADGNVAASFDATQFDIDPSGVVVTLDDCPIGDVAAWITDAVELILATFASDILEIISVDFLIPEFQALIQGMTRLDGTADFALLSIRATDLEITEDGIAVTAGADVWTPYPVAACVGSDPGEPVPVAVEPLAVSDDPGTHVSVALGVSLLRDAVYHMWRRGLLCLTDDIIRELGVTFDFDTYLSILPGFATGTRFDLALRIGVPPSLTAIDSSATAIQLGLDAVHVDVLGTAPDGTQATLAIDAFGAVSARIRFEPFLNALMLTIDEVQIDSLLVTDAPFEVDAERLRVVIQDYMVAPIIEELGDVQLLGPIVGLADWYSIPRLLNTTTTDVRMGVQLYRAPVADDVAPSTLLSSIPTSPATPRNAEIVMAGTDDQTPADLMRFEVSLDEAAPVTTFAKRLKVGAAGITASYDVTVRAMDLSGNADASPVSVTIVVDGVKPSVRFADPLPLRQAPGRVRLRWTASDDLTPGEALPARVSVYRFVEPTSMLERVLVQQLDGLGAVTTAEIALADPGSYAAVVTVWDQAGNPGEATTVYQVEEAAGCRQGASDGLATGLVAAALAVRRRRGVAHQVRR